MAGRRWFLGLAGASCSGAGCAAAARPASGGGFPGGGPWWFLAGDGWLGCLGWRDGQSWRQRTSTIPDQSTAWGNRNGDERHHYLRTPTVAPPPAATPAAAARTTTGRHPGTPPSSPQMEQKEQPQHAGHAGVRPPPTRIRRESDACAETPRSRAHVGAPPPPRRTGFARRRPLAAARTGEAGKPAAGRIWALRCGQALPHGSGVFFLDHCRT